MPYQITLNFFSLFLSFFSDNSNDPFFLPASIHLHTSFFFVDGNLLNDKKGLTLAHSLTTTWQRKSKREAIKFNHCKKFIFISVKRISLIYFFSLREFLSFIADFLHFFDLKIICSRNFDLI